MNCITPLPQCLTTYLFTYQNTTCSTVGFLGMGQLLGYMVGITNINIIGDTQTTMLVTRGLNTFHNRDDEVLQLKTMRLHEGLV